MQLAPRGAACALPCLAAVVAIGVAGPARAQNTNVYGTDSVWASEDVAGSRTDADQNDVALRVNTRCVISPTSRLVLQEVHGVALSSGASLTDALWWSPNASGAPDEVTLTVDAGAPTTVCSGDCAVDVPLFDDFREAFDGATDPFVNTDGGGIVAGLPFAVVATWAGGAPYVGPCEVRLSLRRPGVVIDTASTRVANGFPLVGVFADTCAAGDTCPPSALGPWSVPVERTSIAVAYPDFLTWATPWAAGTCTEGNCPAEDWYLFPDAGHIVDRRGDFATTASLPPQPTCSDGSRNQDETGVDCGGTVCPSCAPPFKTVFVSSARYDGALGGLAGADAKCATLATNAGLSGTFKAWLSDASTSAGARLTHATVPYKRRDGVTVASNWTDLTDGTLLAPISISELGTAPTDTNQHAWTGTNPDGTVFVGVTTNCSGWTTAASGSTGRCGYPTQSEGIWSQGASRNCNTTHHLYCIEQ